MARFYSNENVPLACVRELRRLGHEVLTSMEAGNANQALPDEDVLAFACRQTRTVLILTAATDVRITGFAGTFVITDLSQSLTSMIWR